MKSIKAVLFDYGNVLCYPQMESDVVSMAACCRVDLNRFKTLYWQLRDDYDLGALSAEEYWTKIGRKGGQELTAEQIGEAIRLDNEGWTRPNMVMIEWAARVRESGLATAIVSNMPLSIRLYLNGCTWLPKFDNYTFSCDINSVKPAPDIYLSCLRELSLNPEHALFIDDRQMNVDAALQLSINSLVFTDAESLDVDLKRYEIPAIGTKTPA